MKYQVQFTYTLPNLHNVMEQRHWGNFERSVILDAVRWNVDCYHSGGAQNERHLCFEFLTELDAESFCDLINHDDATLEKFEWVSGKHPDDAREELFFKVDMIDYDELDHSEIIKKTRKRAETLWRSVLIETFGAYIDDDMLQAIARLSDDDAATYILDGWEENERDKDCIFEALAWHDSVVTATRLCS